MNAKTAPDEAPQPPEAASNAEERASEPEQPDPALPATETTAAEASGEEPAAPMDNAPHVHAPQGGIHNWRDFFIQTAVVAIGVLLALGLEQAVEATRHAHQRAQLEEQMRETFEANAQTISDNLATLEGFRAYLVESQIAVTARLHGRPTPLAPAATDPRNYTYVPPPNLGSYEASKANGAVALLNLDRIRLYDRIEFTYNLMEFDHQRYVSSLYALRSFRERYDSSPVARFRVPPIDLALLSTADLVEYRALIGNTLGAVGSYALRLRIMDAQGHAILDGARDERELRAAAVNAVGGSAPPAGHETGATNVGGSHD